MPQKQFILKVKNLGYRFWLVKTTKSTYVKVKKNGNLKNVYVNYIRCKSTIAEFCKIYYCFYFTLLSLL